jgi:alpha-1,4-digalacturonate transport system substrate-binding protein
MRTSILTAALLAAATGAHAGDVRVMWYSDGVEGEVIQDLLDRFMVENPDINVILDNVAYQVIQEQLPIQLQAGQGPDIARVTNLKEQADHWLDLAPYLSDPDYWRANFGDTLDWMRPDGSDAITGFMTQLTLTGGFANATLFEQAGVEMPGDDATWDDWVEASSQVATALELPAAFAIDRSGHRISGPNVSYGANYIAPDGMPAPVDEGVRTFVEKLVQWTEEGKNYKDVWVSAAGSTYRAAADDFINAQIPFYYSGSWQVANLSTKIGDAFDWVATGSPCGTEACSGLAGGAALVAIKYTQNPEEVAKVIEFLGSEPVVKEFTERTLFLPAHKGII